MDSGREAFPNDIEELKAALVAARSFVARMMVGLDCLPGG
jgi:hypothetical protein